MVRSAPGTPQALPEVTARPSPDALRISSKLRSKLTKMYGAYWCTHCFLQKQRLDNKAWAMIENVECDRHSVKNSGELVDIGSAPLAIVVDRDTAGNAEVLASALSAQ